MKKSISKKLLALFLAVLMVVTAVPVMAFAATPDTTALETAISDYENKMSSNNKYGNILTNLSSAYEKYVAAKRLYDAVYYGGVDVAQQEISSAASNLTTETNKMTVYTGKTPVYKNIVFGPNTDDYVYTDDKLGPHSRFMNEASQKVLWAPSYTDGKNSGQREYNFSTADTTVWTWATSDTHNNNYLNMQIHYDDSVLLYDGGAEKPRFPVMADTRKNIGTANSVQFYSIWPGTLDGPDSNFELIQYGGADQLNSEARWTGGLRQDNFREADYTNNLKTKNGDVTNFLRGYYTGDPSNGKLDIENDNRYYWYSSAVEYKGDMKNQNGDPVYANSFVIEWSAHGYAWYQGGLFGSGNWKAYQNASTYPKGDHGATNHRTGIVNWQAIQALAKKASGYEQLTSPQNYMGNSESIKTMFKYIDYVTSFNPNAPQSFNQFSNNPSNTLNYSEVQQTMSTINSDMQNASSYINSNINADNSYQNLRTAMDKCKATYEDLKSKGVAGTKYTTSSYNAYINAYENAQKLFTVDNTYSNSEGAKTAASNLNVALVERADFDAYNTAKAKLNDANNKYDYEKLSELNLDFDRYSLDTEAQKDIAAKDNDKDNQALIDAEAAKMNSLKEFDTSAYEKALNDVRVGIDNTDKYDATELEKVFKTIEENYLIRKATVSAKGDSKVEITGYDYDSATTKLLTALNEAQFDYDVKIVNADGTEEIVATGKHYGDTVTIPKAEYKSAVKAGATDTVMEPVYIGETDKIVVRGDTELTSCNNAENEKVVKFVSGDRVYDIQSTSGDTFDLKTAKVYPPAGYTVSGYKIGDTTYEPNKTITLTDKVTEVTVILTANESIGVVTVNDQTYKFGQKVTLKSDTGEFYAEKNGDLLWTGDEYTFYARETVNITYTPVEGAEAKNAHTSAAVISNGAAYFHGSISNKGNAIAQGMVMDLSGNAKENLTLADVGKDKMILNATAQSIDANTKQYIISMSLPPTARTVTYRAYVAYEVDGKTVYEYSNTTGTFELAARSN